MKERSLVLKRIMQALTGQSLKVRPTPNKFHTGSLQQRKTSDTFGTINLTGCILGISCGIFRVDKMTFKDMETICEATGSPDLILLMKVD